MAKKLKKFYSDSYVGRSILNKANELINKDTKYYWQPEEVYTGENSRGNIKHAIAVEKYRLAGVEFVENKEGLQRLLEENAPGFWKTHDINVYWQQYLTRDRLIAAGLYEKARQEIQVENYIDTAEMFLGESEETEEILYNLKKLTVKQFNALLRPNSDRNSVTTAVPSIQELYTIAKVQTDSSHYEDFAERFKIAFKEAGLKWHDIDEDVKVENDNDEKITIYKTKDVDIIHYYGYVDKIKKTLPKDKYSKTYKQQVMFATKAERKEYGKVQPMINNSIDARKEALRALYRREQSLLSRGKALVYISRAGKYYIPGVSKEVTEDYLKTYYGK